MGSNGTRRMGKTNRQANGALKSQTGCMSFPSKVEGSRCLPFSKRECVEGEEQCSICLTHREACHEQD